MTLAAVATIAVAVMAGRVEIADVVAPVDAVAGPTVAVSVAALVDVAAVRIVVAVVAADAAKVLAEIQSTPVVTASRLAK